MTTCAIVTDKHRKIAKELEMNEHIVALFHGLYMQKHPNAEVSKEMIMEMAKNEEIFSERNRFYVMKHNDTGSHATSRNPTITYFKDGKLYVNYLQGSTKDPKGQMNWFFYELNKENSRIFKHAYTIIDVLVENDFLTSREELKEILRNPYEVYNFMIWREQAYKEHGLTKGVFADDYKATEEALIKARAFKRAYPKRKNFSSEISITQNANGRLGIYDTEDGNLYKQAMDVLADEKSSRAEIKEAEKTLEKLYNKKRKEIRKILDTFSDITDATFTIEDARGTWEDGGEYSFRITIEADTQEDYDKAMQCISCMAEGLRQDAFIENLGAEDITVIPGLKKSGELHEKLMNGEYTPSIVIPFKRKVSAREMSIAKKAFDYYRQNGTNIDATITAEEIIFYFPSFTLKDNATTKDYEDLYHKWKATIINILRNGKETRLSDFTGRDVYLRYEKSRFHSADKYAEGTKERTYENYRNSNFNTEGQQRITNEQKERIIRDSYNIAAGKKLAFEEELEKIKQDAIKNGTFLKAPNGRVSNLNERQWLFVRTKSFKKWFGDWEAVIRSGTGKTSISDANVSKVVDENGEPLVVYHGGAQEISEFHHSNEENSNTGYGYYIDKKTGEKIPYDSNNAIFFSSNRHVGQSYASLTGIKYFQIAYNKIQSIIYGTNVNKEFAFDEHLSSVKEVFDFLSEMAEINPRFESLKKYLQKLRKKGETLSKPNEIAALKEMLLEMRKILRELTESHLMILSENENTYNRSAKIIEEYNTSEGIKRLINGEIPETIQKEWALYEKIRQQRDKEGRDKVNNYDNVYLFLGEGRFALTYDGKNLVILNPEYKDTNVSDMTEKELSDFFNRAKKANQEILEDIQKDKRYQALKGKSQLYAVFLNLRNPLIHDYEGTEQGQGYKNSEKYPFGYVAARQVKSALKNGNDGVVYQNLYDPYLADNYGVFKPNQIKSATDNIGEYDNADAEIQYSIEQKKEVQGENISSTGKRSIVDQLIDQLEASGIKVNKREAMAKFLEKHSTKLLQQFVVGEKSLNLLNGKIKKLLRTWDLSVAKTMEKKNKDAKTIKMATGWERGADGKWRYEIGDVRIKDSLIDNINNLNGKTFSLEEFVEKNTLPNYERLKTLKILIEDLGYGVYGGYSESENLITINPNYIDEINTTLNHEIQHLIQSEEDFETGANRELVYHMFPKELKDLLTQLNNSSIPSQEEVRQIGRKMTLHTKRQDLFDKREEAEFEKDEKTVRSISFEIEEINQELKEIEEKIRILQKERNKACSEIREKIIKLEFSYYERAAGEVEARTVMKRFGLPKEHRRTSLFTNSMYKDVAKEDIIFLKLEEDKYQEYEDFTNENQTFTTPDGEVYGFVDKDGNIYLDETVISPEHPIHEYTHLWDRVVANKNSRLWKKGVELMKKTDLWKEIENDENYGKKWKKAGISGERLEFLIASEVHARLVGQAGEQILNKIEEEQGSDNIISKLKNWLKQFWANLKETFGVYWSKEDIENLTLEEINRMVLRDFANGIDLNSVSFAKTSQDTQKQQSQQQQTKEEQPERTIVDGAVQQEKELEEDETQIPKSRIIEAPEHPYVTLTRKFDPLDLNKICEDLALRFYKKLIELRQEMINEVKEELIKHRAMNNKRMVKKLQERLKKLNDSRTCFPVIINYYTFSYVAGRVHDDFVTLASTDKDDFSAEILIKTIVYYQYLVEISVPYIERLTNLKLRYAKVKNKIGNTNIVNSNVIIEEERTENEEVPDDEADNANFTVPFFDAIEDDPYKSLSQKVIELLSGIEESDFYEDGETSFHTKALDPKYVYMTLMTQLPPILMEHEFMKFSKENGESEVTYPALEVLAEKYEWLNQLIEKLDYTTASAIYSAVMKSPVYHYYVKTENGTLKSTLANGPEGSFYFRSIIALSFANGAQHSKLMIYDKNRKMNKENAQKILDTLKEIDSANLTEEDIENIVEAIRAIGFPQITYEEIESISKTENGADDIWKIGATLEFICDMIIRRGTEKKFDYLYSNHYNFVDIAEILFKSFKNMSGTFFLNGKSYASYKNPSHVDLWREIIKSGKFKQYIEEHYKKYDFFFDKETGYRGSSKDIKCWIDLLENDEDVRRLLETIDMLTINGVEWQKTTSLEVLKARIRMYFINERFTDRNGVSSAYYGFPLLETSKSMLFIKMPCYVKNEKFEFKHKIISGLTQVAWQELNRIKLTRTRRKKGVKSKIANFDKNGMHFQFLPFLNEHLEEIVANRKDFDKVNEIIYNAIKDYLETASKEFIEEYQLATNSLLIKDKELEESELEEYFYNSYYANSQIIQLFFTDLAYFKNHEDFVKRAKAIAGSGVRLNTSSMYGKKERTVLHLSEVMRPSTGYEFIARVFDNIEKKWIKNGLSKEVARQRKEEILKNFENIKATDGQAYITLDAYRSILDMMGNWTKEMQSAYDNITSGNVTYEDFFVLWNTIKPFIFTSRTVDSGIDNTKIKVPTIYKDSEALLLAMYTAVAASTGKDPTLVALSRFMKDHNIDAAVFESGIKAGVQNSANIQYSDKKIDEWVQKYPHIWKEVLSYCEQGKKSRRELFLEGNLAMLKKGKLSQKDYNHRMKLVKPTAEELYEMLKEQVVEEDGSLKKDITAVVPYSDYMIASTNTDHFFDNDGYNKENFGSQIRVLTLANLPKDIQITFQGKTLGRKEILDLYFDILDKMLAINEERAGERLKDKNFLKQLMMSSQNSKIPIQSLAYALEIDEYGDFTFPLSYPAFMKVLEKQLTSFIRKSVNVQKVKGFQAIITADPTGKLGIKYKMDDQGNILGIEYAEVMAPWYVKNMIDPNSKEIDLDKIPKKLREGIFYKIPTEGKCAIIKFKIVGFLPQQAGGAMMIPGEVVQISGCDFDNDKVSTMMYEYYEDYVDWEGAKEEYDKRGIKDIAFKEWIKSHKSEFILETPEIRLVKYDVNGENDIEALNNMLVDLFMEITGHESYLEEGMTPNNADPVTRAMLVSQILQSRKILESLIDTTGIDKNDNAIFKALMETDLETLKSIYEEYKPAIDPLSPATFVNDFNEVVIGEGLISIAAVNLAYHAKLLENKIELNEGYTFTINGKKIEEIDPMYDADGNLVSTNMMRLSSAAVDNAKNPVFGNLNINRDTIGLVATMLRCGIPIEMACLMLQTPFIQGELLEKGAITIESLRENCIDAAVNINLEDVLRCIMEGNPSSTTTKMINTFVFRMMRISYDLSFIDTANRADTKNGGIPNSFGGVMAKLYYNSYAAQHLTSENSSIKHDFKGTIASLFMDHAIYSANEMFKELFPVLKHIEPYMKDVFNMMPISKVKQDIADKFITDYMQFVLTSISKRDEHQRNWFLYSFPGEYLNTVTQEMRDNYACLEYIKVVDGEIQFSIPHKIDENTIAQMTAEFDRMSFSKDPVENKIAEDLFWYSFYKYGYKNTNTSPMKYFSFYFLKSLDGFTEAMTRVDSPSQQSTMNNFIEQFILNNYMSMFKTKSKSKTTNKTAEGFATPTISTINIMTGVPYKYFIFENQLHKLSHYSKYYAFYNIVDTKNFRTGLYDFNRSSEELISEKVDQKLIDDNKKLNAKPKNRRQIEQEELMELLANDPDFLRDDADDTSTGYNQQSAQYGMLNDVANNLQLFISRNEEDISDKLKKYCKKDSKKLTDDIFC